MQVTRSKRKQVIRETTINIVPNLHRLLGRIRPRRPTGDFWNEQCCSNLNIFVTFSFGCNSKLFHLVKIFTIE